MHKNYIVPNMDRALPVLATTLMADGHDTGSRNGRTMEQTMVSVTLERPTEREITILGRKANIAAQIAETAWVLAGRNDVEFLSHYLPRAKSFSDDGKTWRGGYGPRLRSWEAPEHIDGAEYNVTRIDQLDHVVGLLRSDPLTRRAVMSIYNPAIDSEPGKDIPCNDFVIFSNRLGKLDMHVTVRSNDLWWGFSGINAFEWSALQEIVAGMVGVNVGALHFSTGSLHIYEHHWDKAVALSQSREVWDTPVGTPSPAFDATGMDDAQSLDYMLDQWFYVEELIRTGKTDPAGGFGAHIDEFPEPMFRSWLRVLAWYWTGDHSHLKPLAGTRLEYATHMAVQPDHGQYWKDLLLAEATERIKKGGGREHILQCLQEFGYRRVTEVPGDKARWFLQRFRQEPRPEKPEALKSSEFIDMVVTLHNEKDMAYGDSWKKRGEMLSILANIARKVDRLGGAETADETSVDTAIDLFVYLAKYDTWLQDKSTPTMPDVLSSRPDAANATIRLLGSLPDDCNENEYRVVNLKDEFENLTFLVQNGRSIAERRSKVDTMLGDAYRLAYSLWQAERAEDEAAILAAATMDADEYRANLGQ